MTAIEDLLSWASAQGIALHGITPRVLPGRGIGIVATGHIKANQDVLHIPTARLRSLGNTSPDILSRAKGASKEVFPSKEDVANSMPLCWPQELQELLPPKAKTLLAKQKNKFDRDWTFISTLWPEVSREDFIYAWLLVNSRTFYHTTRRTRKLPKEDHMVLQPVADLFNHSPRDDACRVAYDERAYTFTTSRAHEPGEELFIRYGAHHNDFLLVEYGFTLPLSINTWDETCLDPYICPRFSQTQKDKLEASGFWGKYMLDATTACYRTQIALRMLVLDDELWKAVLEGDRDEDKDQARVDEELIKILGIYEQDIRSTLAEIDRTGVGEEFSREMLRQRWLQIKELVITTLARLIDS